MKINILALSDVETGLIYSERSGEYFPGVDLIVSCGDLPMSYLDYAATTLNAPLYFVLGNHNSLIPISKNSNYPYNSSGYNLHCSNYFYEKRLLIAGVEGSVKYNNGPQQYSQSEMWSNVFSLIPALLRNKLLHGRYLDIFVSHAPPWQIHDQQDLPHNGIHAFRWLDKVFKPKIHLHGHIHVYRPDTVRETVYYNTKVINCYGYREILFDEPTDNLPKES